MRHIKKGVLAILFLFFLICKGEVVAETSVNQLQQNSFQLLENVTGIPKNEPLLGVFGETVLRLPYGITIDQFEGEYHLYVTDNYETPDEETPPGRQPGAKGA